MKEAFENLQNAEVEPREKLKVTKADIVVALPLGEPYFNIHYREFGNDYDNIGFGSYDLNNVIRWREEEMEIVSEVEAEYGNGWIPVEQRLPEESSDVLIATRSSIVGVGTYFENIGWVQWYSGGSIAVDVTHWQPLPSLPQPYKPTTD